MPLTEEYKQQLDKAVKAVHSRSYYEHFPEHPKAYGKEAAGQGEEDYKKKLNSKFEELEQDNPTQWAGEEVSPYTLEKLGVQYPIFDADTLVQRSKEAQEEWKKVAVEDRAVVLMDALEQIKDRFFEIAYATMHTTGQAFMMSFQASGPHANDRAMEAIAMGYEEQNRFPNKVEWEKPVGKEDTVKLEKAYKPIPKGVGLVIGCATFPVWNSMPGLFGDLITGNTVLFKPHPESVMPLALILAEVQKAAKKHGYNPRIAQLAADTQDNLLTKDLAEHDDVSVIDFTGSSQMGEYIESLINKGKTVFTEKAGVNSVIIDSMDDLKGSMQNLSFAVSLYSGQMCTAPQNFYIPKDGIEADGEQISYEDTVNALKEAIDGLANHPKMGHNVLGAVHDEKTLERANNAEQVGGRLIRKAEPIEHPDFENARTCSPAIIEVDAADRNKYEQELFGPVIVVIKTKNTEESVQIAKELSKKKGAITCAAYTTDENKMDYIEEEMEEAFVPVTFNLLGPGPVAVNQNESFSDFHVSGGNPAGNASFTDPDFINRRFRWIGHKRRV